MKEETISPAFGESCVAIFLVASEFYAPYCAVTLQAIVDHSSLNFNYDIVISFRNTQNAEYLKNKLLRCVTSHKNISLRFVDVPKMLHDNGIVFPKDFSSLSHVSEETFYRLFIPSIFSNYDKILYLDIDLVPLEDVANLYNIDLGDAWIAGCQDFGVMMCYVTSKTHKNYFDEKLKINPFKEYINSGVALYNIKQMNKNGVVNKFVQEATKNKFLFCDQDIINYICKNHIKQIDSTWNETNQANVSCLPEIYKKKRLEDARNHRIVHWCTGYRKPWINPAHETSFLWWEVARHTPFYEEILYRNIKEQILNDVKKQIPNNESENHSRTLTLDPKHIELIRGLVQLPDYRRKLKRIHLRRLLSWGRKRERYLAREKELQNKIKRVEEAGNIDNFFKI